MHARLALFALLAIAVGCGSSNEPESSPPSAGEGTPAPAPAPASGEESTPPSEAQSSQSATEPVPGTGAASSAAPCKVGFQKDILPKLSETCGASSCHGASTNRPYIELASPKTTHDELMEFEFGSIEWSDPHSETSGASAPDFRKAIDQWRMCGAKLD